MWWLFVPMRYLIPVGFVLMLAGILSRRTDPTVHDILRAACELPVSAFLVAGLLCLVLTGIFAVVLDSSKVRSNWIEQITNCVGQFAFFLSVILLTFAADCSHADRTAKEALRSTDTVQVTVSDDEILFRPQNSSGPGLIFYPGGKVEFSAYAPLLRSLAEEGITCIIVRMPLQIAILDVDAADRVITQHPEISRWYIAGHSFGGIAASDFARQNPDKTDGLILLASYSRKPLGDLEILSVLGSEDGVLNHSAYDRNKRNLPDDAVELIIPGANHAQFGNYGPQDSDGRATISSEEQQEITRNAIIQFMTHSKD